MPARGREVSQLLPCVPMANLMPAKTVWRCAVGVPYAIHITSHQRTGLVACPLQQVGLTVCCRLLLLASVDASPKTAPKQQVGLCDQTGSSSQLHT